MKLLVDTDKKDQKIRLGTWGRAGRSPAKKLKRQDRKGWGISEG